MIEMTTADALREASDRLQSADDFLPFGHHRKEFAWHANGGRIGPADPYAVRWTLWGCVMHITARQPGVRRLRAQAEIALMEVMRGRMDHRDTVQEMTAEATVPLRPYYLLAREFLDAAALIAGARWGPMGGRAGRRRRRGQRVPPIETAPVATASRKRRAVKDSTL